MSDRQKLGNEAAAQYVGVAGNTWRSYVARGQAPKADGYDEGFRQDYWLKRTLDRWQASRPGHGGRPPKTTSRRASEVGHGQTDTI